MWIEEPDLDEWEHRCIEAWEEHLALGHDITFEQFREDLLDVSVDCDDYEENFEGELA